MRTIPSMLRALLVGLLAVTTTSSCSDGGDTVKVAPGASAGKVIEVSGNVAATRGGATRALAAGAEVFADDELDTTGGSMVIFLHHNNARWAVERGQGARLRVDGSLAWSLAKQAGPAQVVDHASSAAGREGERAAADTRPTTERGGTAPRPAAAMESSGEAAKPAAPAAPPALPADVQAPTTRPPSADPVSGNAAVEGAAGGGDDRGKGGGAVGGKKPRGAGVPTASDPSATGLVAPNASDARLLASLEAKRAELRRCTGAKPVLTLVVRVAAGAPTIELLRGTASTDARACLERVVRKLPLAGLTATASIDLSVDVAR